MSPTQIAAELAQLDPASPLYATQMVEALLRAAEAAGASDIHLQPTPQGLVVTWRIDGVLQPIGEFSRGQAADVVARLKVLAQLLTYRTDAPQEGRIRRRKEGLGGTESSFSASASSASRGSATSSSESPRESVGGVVEMRVSTFPTLHGERAVIRLFASEDRYSYVADLALPEDVSSALVRMLGETSGAIVLTGPAGSGKTTTAYACLREIARASRGQRSIVTLEDPVEVALAGVSQSQVQPAAGFTLAAGLRSLMRQDPEVVLVGEIRDVETVQTVFQAALTGHLVISTFHAGSAAGALSRLLDMGIEPYLLTSGMRGVLHQRLVRKLCDCAVEIAPDDAAALLGLSVNRAKAAAGCERCRQTGYRGRLALAEMLPPLAGELGQAVLQRRETAQIASAAVAGGMTSVLARACAAVAAGQTDPAEVRRVLGFLDETGPASG